MVEDLIRGPVAFPNAQLRRLRDRPRRRLRPLQLRGRRRRRRDGDHRGGPRRRPPLQHAEAAARPRGARPRAAALRPPAAAARARRQEALQAPRRRLGPGAARRRLPAGGGPQLPGPARLGHRRRHDADVDRGAGRALPGRGRRQVRRRSSTRRSCAGSTAASCASCRSTSTPRRSPVTSAASPTSACAAGLRDRPGESPDAGRGLAADPLPLRAAGRRRRRPGEGDEGGARASCWRPPPRLWPRSSPSTVAEIEAALAPLLDRFEVKPGKLYQPIRVAITGTSVSPGIFESLAVLGRAGVPGADRYGRGAPGGSTKSDAMIEACRSEAIGTFG